MNGCSRCGRSRGRLPRPTRTRCCGRRGSTATRRIPPNPVSSSCPAVPVGTRSISWWTSGTCTASATTSPHVREACGRGGPVSPPLGAGARPADRRGARPRPRFLGQTHCGCPCDDPRYATRRRNGARRAVNTVDEALDKAPGVQFLYGQVNIRGSTGYVQGLGSRVLLLVDGVPANQGDRGGINWDLVPLDEVQRVEIVKGAGSSLYGSAALGGVVNLLTRDIEPGFHARLRATGASYANPPHDVWRFRDYTGGEESLGAMGSYGGELVRASITGGGWHSDGYREQDRRNHWQTAAKLDWRPASATRVTASGSWASDQYETPLIWCTRGGRDDPGQAYQPFMIDTSGRGSFTRSDKGYLTATVERTPSERLSWLARGSWLRTHFIDYQPANNDAGVANRVGAELRALVRPAEDRVVTVGEEAARSDVMSDIFGDHSQNELAAYGESEQRFGRARITAGGRGDYLPPGGGGVPAGRGPPRGGAPGAP